MARWLDHRYQARLVRTLQLRRPGPLRTVGRALYGVAVGAEISTVRAVDRVRRSAPRPAVHDLTAVVKTFERPSLVDRLLASIRRYQPDLPVIVVDDSRRPREFQGAELVALPYDSGISAGRMAGLAAVRTPYFLLLDDDVIFYGQTDLAPVVDFLDRHPEVDIVGGRVFNLPLVTTIDYAAAPLFPTDAVPIVEPGVRIEGREVMDKVSNFLVGRTDRVLEVGWDPELKILEHRDFFTRARGRLTSVEDRSLRALHAQSEFDDEYLARRHDLDPYREVLARRWGTGA